MIISTSAKVTEVMDGEYPFYVKEQESAVPEESSVPLAKIPQGPGSKLDSDTVDGIQAVTASAAGPNKLVATDEEGLLPTSVIPTLSGAPIISNRAGTLFYTIYVEDDGAISYDPVI